MSIIRKSNQSEGTSDYVNLKPGEYDARLAYVADLGLQERSYAGEEKTPAQQLSLCMELIGEVTVIDGQEVPRTLWCKPFNIFFKMSDKGKEYELYKALNPSAKPDTVADWDAVLGNPCSITVINKLGTDGKLYDNIESVQSIPLKYQDNVGQSSFTDQCTGDSEDENSPAQKAMFGLAKHVHEKRILEGDEDEAEAAPVATADESFDEDCPF